MKGRGNSLAVTFVIALITALAMGCSGSVPPPTDGGVDANKPPLAWQPVLENLDGALLSIWGPKETNELLTVGGPLGNTGFDALVMRYDGKGWTRLLPGGTSSFWWVSGSGARDVWMVGEKGRISHFDGTSFVERPEAAGAYTLYGVWAASPSSAYAVGGVAETGKGPQNDVLLVWNGTTWRREPLPTEEGRALFKVWGRNDDDVYVVGEAGIVWHKSQGSWKREANEPPLARGTLLTVFGCEDGRVFAVGGRDVLVRKDGVWKRDDVELFNDVNGGACGKDGTVVLVGLGGMKLRNVQNAWIDDAGAKPYADLHGAFIDEKGTLWGVGGSYLSSPKPGIKRNGVVARYGP